MSPEIIKLNISQPEKEEAPSPNNSWFDAYLEGNMRVPQTSFGIELFLLDAVLKSEEFAIDKFKKSRLAPEQLKRMRDAMNSAHSLRNIPSRSSEKVHQATEQIKAETGKSYHPSKFKVKDSDLEKLWENLASEALSLAGRILKTSGDLRRIGNHS